MPLSSLCKTFSCHIFLFFSIYWMMVMILWIFLASGSSKEDGWDHCEVLFREGDHKGGLWSRWIPIPWPCSSTRWSSSWTWPRFLNWVSLLCISLYFMFKFITRGFNNFFKWHFLISNDFIVIQLLLFIYQFLFSSRQFSSSHPKNVRCVYIVFNSCNH